MMQYSLKYKSKSYLNIIRIYNKFELIPNNFKYTKTFPKSENTFKKVIIIQLRWLFWEYDLLIRKT
jgi:hypothetical protein